MTDRRYLKWYNKIGYGAGDIAGNVIYAFISTFIMIYLTDTAGLNAGIVGTLMMISIIANFYKSEKYIPKLIDSVLEQNYTDWELVCVNDCSPGNDLEILRKYAIIRTL